MRGPASSARAAGVAVQGATVGRDGRLDPGHADRVRVHKGTLDLTVASGSAVVITLDDCD